MLAFLPPKLCMVCAMTLISFELIPLMVAHMASRLMLLVTSDASI
jgi:hypothetical protein